MPKLRMTKEGIAEYVRQKILDGEWKPGSRLPTRLDLEKKLGASTATIQRAMDQLMEDRFVCTRGRAGTFVSEHLPNRYQIGMVFPPLPQLDQPASRFWNTLKMQADRLEPDGPIWFRAYHEVTARRGDPNYERLREDIEQHRLAGLVIMPMSLGDLQETNLIHHLGLACVAVKTSPVAGVPTVTLGAYVDRVLDEIASKGRRRLALVYQATEPMDSVQHPVAQGWFQAAVRRNLETRNYWFLPVHARSPQTARVGVNLMMRLPPEDRPDAMIIGDDHLVDCATAGVHDAGVRVPDELEVYAHCNFPDRPPSCVPVRRVGYDIGKLLTTCLDIIQRQLRGVKVPKVTALQPVFEEEVTTAGI